VCKEVLAYIAIDAFVAIQMLQQCKREILFVEDGIT
jgi:hypothetical protein